MKHWKKKPWVDSEVRNWDYIADHIAPDATSADAGKVLTVGETGKPEWGEGGGSGSGAYIINLDFTTYTLDKTWQEVFDNFDKLCVIVIATDMIPLKQYIYIDSVTIDNTDDQWPYKINAITFVQNDIQRYVFSSESVDGYPQLHSEN